MNKKDVIIPDIAAQTVALILSYDQSADPDGYPQFLFDAIVAAATLAANEAIAGCWIAQRFVPGTCSNN